MEISNYTDYGIFLSSNPILFTEDLIPIQTIYVSQIFRGTTEDELKQYFTKYGPISNVQILKTQRNYTFGFVTFQTVEDAAIALKSEDDHIISDRRIKISGADSWHQPKIKILDNDDLDHNNSDDNELTDINSINLLTLNDDCLLHILSYLTLFDLLRIENVSYRLKDLAKITLKRYKILDFFCVKGDELITLMDARNILSQIGHQLITINVPAVKFQTSNKRILELLPKYCYHLQHISLEGFTLNVPTLKKFSFIFKKIKSLNLKSCCITEHIERFLKRATLLEDLNLSQNFEINGRCLTDIKNLKSLNLDSCVNLQPKYFSSFCVNNRTLQYLNISSCERINETNVLIMIENFNNLEHLVISNSYSTLDQTFMAEFAKLEKLKKLQVKFISFANVNLLLEELAKKNILEYLDISSCTNSIGTISAIYRFTKLKILKLNYRMDLSDETLIKITENNNLNELYIAGCFRISNDGLLRIINQSTNLRLLDISGCDRITDQLIYNTVDILKGYNRIEKLEIIVGETQIERDIIENDKIKNISNLLKVSFESNYEAHFLDSYIFDDLLENSEFESFDDVYLTSESEDDWF